MRIGLIGRCDNCGLGNMSWAFHDNLPIVKTLLFKRSYACFPDRFKNNRLIEHPTQLDIDWLLDGIDTLIAIETPYDWEIFKQAQRKGIKTVMIPMPEFFPDRMYWHLVDMWWCISPLEYEMAPANKVFIRNPVDKKKIKFRLREAAKTFVAHLGHGGIMGRNGSSELVAAIKKARGYFKTIIYSQFPIKVDTPRIEVRPGNIKNYDELWNEGDVFVHLCKFGGDHMPINEAMAAGMPVIALDHCPWNKFVPKETLVDPLRILPVSFGMVTCSMAMVDVDKVAEKIEMLAGEDIRHLSMKSDSISNTFSWETLKPKILEIL